MYYSVSLDSCPKCNDCYSFSIYDLSTGLGPALAQCRLCKAQFQSGKTEWAKLPRYDKALFWILTLLYTVTIGAFSGVMSFCIIQSIRYGNTKYWPSLETEGTSTLLFICILGIAALIFSLQIYRIRQSLIRTQKRFPTPILTAFSNLEFGLQMKFLYLWGVLFAIAGLMLTYR
jgi:hypothetical protein